MVITRLFECTDVWFEPTPNGTALMVATAEPCIRQEIVSGRQIVADAIGQKLLLSFVAYFKGHAVFEATPLRSEGGSIPEEQDRLWQLSGPFQGGHPKPSCVFNVEKPVVFNVEKAVELYGVPIQEGGRAVQLIRGLWLRLSGLLCALNLRGES